MLYDACVSHINALNARANHMHNNQYACLSLKLTMFNALIGCSCLVSPSSSLRQAPLLLLASALGCFTGALLKQRMTMKTSIKVRTPPATPPPTATRFVPLSTDWFGSVGVFVCVASFCKA